MLAFPLAHKNAPFSHIEQDASRPPLYEQEEPKMNVLGGELVETGQTAQERQSEEHQDEQRRGSRGSKYEIEISKRLGRYSGMNPWHCYDFD
jgi:hypothetical protein